MERTERLIHITRTPPLFPILVQPRAMGVRVMFVTNLVKEVKLVLRAEERSGNAVHGCVTPALVVKPALRVEIIKEG